MSLQTITQAADRFEAEARALALPLRAVGGRQGASELAVVLAETARLVIANAETKAVHVPATEVAARLSEIQALDTELTSAIEESDVHAAAVDFALIRLESQKQRMAIWLAEHRRDAWARACKELGEMVRRSGDDAQPT